MTTAEEPTRKLVLERADTIKTRRQRWAWDKRIPLGTVTLFAGRGGEGKSTFALHLIAQLNVGALPGDLQNQPVSALIISHEDDWGTVMVPRLHGADADLTRVHRLAVTMTRDSITSEIVPAFPMDLSLIREALERTGARILLVDPITSTIPGDLHKVEAVRAALNPLAAIAAEYDVAVVGILHFNKGTGNASDKISGSHAFRDTARSAVLFATDEETDKRIITFDKSNYSAERGTNLEFTLESVAVHTDDGETTTVARVVGLTESDVSVADIINREPAQGDRSESDEAADWLVSYLESEGGSAPRKAVFDAARTNRYSEKVLRVARGKAGIVANRVGFPSVTVWSLPTVRPMSGPVEPAPESGPDRASVGPDWDDDEEAAPVSYLDHRDEIATRAGLLCPVCNQPTGHRFPGYCDTLDNAHALYRADAEAGAVA